MLFTSCLELRFVNFLLNEYCIVVLYCTAAVQTDSCDNPFASLSSDRAAPSSDSATPSNVRQIGVSTHAACRLAVRAVGVLLQASCYRVMSD